MSDVPRKASDVILSIENYVNEILGHVRNQDMTVKLLINRISSLERAVNNSSPAPASSAPPAPAPASQRQMPGLKPGVNLGPPAKEQQTFTATPRGSSQIDYDESGNEQLEVEVKPVGKRRGARGQTASAVKNVPVQQKILYPDGKNVCLANVEVFSSGKQGQLDLVKKCRTNSAGKWNVSLGAGKYLVSISKVGTSTKPGVEVSYPIEIPVSDKPLELQPFQSS